MPNANMHSIYANHNVEPHTGYKDANMDSNNDVGLQQACVIDFNFGWKRSETFKAATFFENSSCHLFLCRDHALENDIEYIAVVIPTTPTSTEGKLMQSCV